ncbi:molybdenum cofactor guanylyltransferase [Luteibacter anthropi]|uniref:molybdenum cofactor guanylyltransferase n=1 Tax=Luteibacter anthropi TaxID=564369 RepID=UPI0020325372|nr:molybdenum cofactor guanylyltransferase [Luteibacter anthropi]URX64413.1 molybdenum cofactor guanylyltransferase [Luteibacter anthropi]
MRATTCEDATPKSLRYPFPMPNRQATALQPLTGGLILAGGRSSRMGHDKALLKIDGTTLLNRTSQVLRDAGADLVVVSGSRPGGIPDHFDNAGPLGGIASAAPFLPDGRWLVVPVDMPGLCLSVLRPLLECAGAAANWQGHPLPFVLDLDDEVRALVEQLMERPSSERSPGTLLSCLKATHLPLDTLDTRWLVNCNTPDQWREATA